jgi:DNA sulfur modification protein DndD
MLLDSITLKNFRQYYGEQTITFSKSKEQNVTVIHGENGSGKTALLNAFSWCLYGVLNLPNSENIVNEHAIQKAVTGDVVHSEVTIEFWERDLKYIISREMRGKKDTVGSLALIDTDLKLVYIQNGITQKINNPTVEINRILPENLRSYFFFDGERIDNLAKEEGSGDVKDAIKTMMGLEILERSIKHTDTARKRFLEEMKTYADTDTLMLIEREEKLESQIDNFNIQLDQLHENEQLNNKHIQQKEERLKQIEGSKQLQEERVQKQNRLNEQKEELSKYNKKLMDMISKKGYLAFTRGIIQKSREELSVIGTNESTTLSGVTSDFIKKRLDLHECICGEVLEPSSIQYEKVESLLDHLAPKSLDAAISSFKGDLKVIEFERNNVFKELKEIKQNTLKCKQQIRGLQEQIEEISKHLSNKDSEEIADIEKARNILIEQNKQIREKVGRKKFERDKYWEDLKEIQKERKKTEGKVEKANLTQKRMDTCEKLVGVMEKLFKVRERAVKSDLQKRISEVYSKFLRKGYRIHLTDDYELKVFNQNDKLVGMSQGERQITSLSFIGAIVDIAREQFNREHKQSFEEGGIYPLVMDSPFGALDSDHRERIAEGINNLADQVIVIVSTSQWRGEVEGQMKHLIGKEYVLDYHDPRQDPSSPFEYTEMLEVK